MRVTYTLCPRRRLQLPFVPSGRGAAFVKNEINQAFVPRFGQPREVTADYRRRTSHIELVRIPADRWNDRVDAAMRKRLEALLSDAAPKWRRDYRFF